MIACRFFARGLCRNGDACSFLHEGRPQTAAHLQPGAPSFPAIDTLRINSGEVAQAASDSRARVPCKFAASPGGCRNPICPYLHVKDGPEVENRSGLELDQKEDKDQEPHDDFARDLAGAVVQFNEFGDVEKISLSTDYSVARITGLPPQSSPETVVNTLRALEYDINVNCVRIPKQDATVQTMAIVKVEDPAFAQRLSAELGKQQSKLVATSMPNDSRRTNARKVYISWHKSTRNAWLNYGNGEKANKVAQRFNSGDYKVLGQIVKSSAGTRGSFSHGRSNNPVAWTATLSNVPSTATTKDIERAIRSPHDKPRHIEMGTASYRASDVEASVHVRSRLEEHGPLENFYLSPTHTGKRVKATAWFQDEADARSARSLNSTPLSVLGKGKLTVTLIQVAKAQVSTAIYTASKTRIDKESKTWKEQHLTFHVYHDALQKFTTLKVEGENAKDVASARKSIDEIFSGVVLMKDEEILWSPAFSSNGSAYRKIRAIEKALRVIVTRDKIRRQFHYHGPSEKLGQTACQISDMLKHEPVANHEISLSPLQFSWAIRGGFKSIVQALGEDVAVFDIVSKKIAVHGTDQQHEAALDIIDGKRSITALPRSTTKSGPKDDCPICLCEADNPIDTSCGHTYCLECFEECCKAAASGNNPSFQIQCQGNAGTCAHVFTLHELRDRLSSSVLETVLQSSFEGYIKRHPNVFHYCPTPDCDYFYRCTTASGSTRPTYTCTNCLELLCTSCHARHGSYTCAEYKDIQSGGYEALEKLKKELNIKDCPKCSTLMEKIEGCNHMTCGGCKAHICWVCMEVFEKDDLCYAHMNRVHGGIGTGLERFQY